MYIVDRQFALQVMEHQMSWEEKHYVEFMYPLVLQLRNLDLYMQSGYCAEQALRCKLLK